MPSINQRACGSGQQGHRQSDPKINRGRVIPPRTMVGLDMASGTTDELTVLSTLERFPVPTSVRVQSAIPPIPHDGEDEFREHVGLAKNATDPKSAHGNVSTFYEIKLYFFT